MDLLDVFFTFLFYLLVFAHAASELDDHHIIVYNDLVIRLEQVSQSFAVHLLFV
jgi:hypothetical protein